MSMVHVPLTVRSWDEPGVVVEASDPVTVEAAAKDEDRQKRSVPATTEDTVAVLVRLTVVLPPPSAGGSLSHCRFIDDNQATANCIPDRFINSVHFFLFLWCKSSGDLPDGRTSSAASAQSTTQTTA